MKLTGGINLLNKYYPGFNKEASDLPANAANVTYHAFTTAK